MRLVTAGVILGLLAVPPTFATAPVGRPASAKALASERQGQSTPQRAGSVTDDVRAVLVDVVVRDRRGQPVRDLTEADFEIIEDGVRQTVRSFKPVIAEPRVPGAAAASVSAPGTAPAAAAASGTPPPADDIPIVTALVFDRLSSEARKRAVDAARSYFGDLEEAPNYVGIYGVDLSLSTLAPFTRSTRVLRQALDRLATRASSSFDNADRQTRRANAAKQAAASQQTAAAAVAGAAAARSSSVGSAAGAAQLAQMEADMLRDFEVMDRDQEGYASTNGLFAIIHAMSRLPGRKSLVFFSEGIAIPPAVQRLFLGVIDAANRANVSIYTMDAAGLRAESAQASIRDQVNQAAAFGINTGYAGDVSGALTKNLEANEDVLRQDPQMALGQLAQDTGGVLFDSTNNLKTGFQRIEDDLHNYYLLGYTPSNEVYDGRFRRIEVKVKRSGVTVAARKGYFALRDPGGLAVNSWEAPALGALGQKPLPNAFPVRAATLRFPERDRPSLVPVVVAFPTSGITFQPTADGKNYTSDFAVVVQFLDQQNQIVRKVGQHYEVNGPMTGLDMAKKGEVLFYREPELPAGIYTMETVVHDAPSGKSSVRLSTVEVVKADPAMLRMSSVVLVKRAEKVSKEESRPGNPLQVGDLVLSPGINEPFSKAAKEVGFYFAVYPAENGPAPEAVLELLRDGNQVARIPLTLAAPDKTGRIQQVGRLPLEQLPPASYELQVVVRQGDTQVSGVTMLRVVE